MMKTSLTKFVSRSIITSQILERIITCYCCVDEVNVLLKRVRHISMCRGIAILRKVANDSHPRLWEEIVVPSVLCIAHGAKMASLL